MWQVKRTHLSGSIFESSIDEQHDGCFEMDLLLVDPSTSVKVIDQALSIIPIKICAHFHNTFFETNQTFFYQTTKFYQKPQSVCLSFVFLGKIFSHKGLKEWGGGCVKHSHLKSGPLRSKLLVVKHGLQHLPVAPGNQANGSQNFQDCYLCPDIFGGETLSNYVDAVWMSKYMSSALLFWTKNIWLCSILEYKTTSVEDITDIDMFS